MNTGYVGQITGVFEGDEISFEAQTKADGGYEWVVKPEGNKQTTLREGTDSESVIRIFTGSAAWTKVEEQDTVSITENADIRKRTERVPTVHRGHWVVIPSSDLVVTTDKELMGYLTTALPPAVRVEPANIDIRSWTDELSGEQWGSGFSGRIPDQSNGEGIRKGQVYGDAVENDPDLGRDIERGPLNQAGVETWWRSVRVKAYAAESGYVAAWSDDMATRLFSAFLVENIADHLKEG